jgi:hypothetical protein
MDSSFGNPYHSAYGSPEYRDISINQLNQSSFNTSFNRSSDARKRNGYTNTPTYPTTSGPSMSTAAATRPSSENIVSWFFAQILNKQWHANKIIGLFSFLAIIAMALILRFTLWAPFESITGELKMLLSLRFWFLACLATGLFSSAISYFSVQYIFSPSNESVASADRFESKIAFCIFAGLFMGLLLAFPFVINSTTSWNASFTTIAFAWVAALVTAAKIATENDFRLHFTNNAATTGLKGLFHIVVANAQHNIQDNAQRTLRVFQYSYGIVISLCLIFPMIRDHFFHLFDPIMVAHVGVMVFTFFILSDLVCFAVNHVTMVPIEFPLPSPYFFSNIHGNVINLINGMGSSNIFVKLFAFRDFSDKAKSPSKTSFFTLSQPGNHPKLWSAVLTQCLDAVNNVTQKLTKEIETTLTKNASALQYSQFLNGDRSTATLLKPPTLKPKMKPTKEPFEFITFAPIKNKLKPLYDSLQKHFISAKPIIPTVECDIVVFALEGLGSIVECSLTQDRYGIVQKSLSMILSSFVELASCCDQIIRAKAMRRTSASYADTRIFKIRDIVVNVINDIYTAFERHIDDLNLPADKLVLLNEFTS